MEGTSGALDAPDSAVCEVGYVREMEVDVSRGGLEDG